MKKGSIPNILRTGLCTLLVLFCAALSISAEEAVPSKDFNISKIVLCDPDDPLCKPSAFFIAGQNMRINVLQNFSTELRGTYRDLILYIYDSNNEELLKAYKLEQFIWGPHINDKWLCFLPNSLETGLYQIRIVVKVGYKEFEKSSTFSIRNPVMDKKIKEAQQDRQRYIEDIDSNENPPAPKP